MPNDRIVNFILYICTINHLYMTKKEKYRPRIADKLLERKLKGKGAVLVEGAKWCGKTTTAEQICNSVLYMSEPGKVNQNVQLARISPQLLLRGEKPRLIDEWQIAAIMGCCQI